MNSLRTTFVVNPYSAGGRTGRLWPERERIMRECFPEAEVQFTQAPGDATRIARQAVERGQELIVAVGGDGSINEVVNGLMNEGKAAAALGILPSGTGSDLIRALGIPNQFEDALQVLQTGKLRTLDVGLVCATDMPDKPAASAQASAASSAVDSAPSRPAKRHFINVASVGIGAEIAYKVNRGRKRLGATPTFLWATIATLFRYRNPTVRLLQEGRDPETRRIKIITLNNAPYFASGMCIAPDAQPDDGQLDLVVVGNLGRFETMRRLGETYSGRRLEHDDIDYRRCTQVTIEAADQREILVEMDGEIWGPLPASFEVLAGAVQIMVPAR